LAGSSPLTRAMMCAGLVELPNEYYSREGQLLRI
jgi:hypothetical protein